MNILNNSFSSVLGNCVELLTGNVQMYSYIQNRKITFFVNVSGTYCTVNIFQITFSFTNLTDLVASIKVAFNINIHSKWTAKVCLISAHLTQKHRLLEDTKYGVIVRTKPELRTSYGVSDPSPGVCY